jgi:endo-1,4-beta-xylanase
MDGAQAPAAPARTLFTTGFEAHTDGFAGRGGNEALTVSDEAAHEGSHALKVEGRTSSWHGPSLDITQMVTAGKEYTVSLWVKLIEPDTAQVTLSTQIGSGSGASYNNLQGKSLTQAGDWVELRGTYRYLTTDFVSIYVESGASTASFFIDDVTIIEESSPPIVIENITPLKDTYATFFPVGTIASGKDLSGLRLELLTKHFAIATAENAMKPGELQPRKGEFTFAAADAIVNAMRDHGLAMHGHTLAWHQQTGAWMHTGADGSPLPRDEALDNLTTHAKTVVDHFKGRVVSWDVLNEAINDGISADAAADWVSCLRNSPWRKAIGDDYVEAVFLAAQEADPDAKLYYNDYNLDNQNKAAAVYNMVKALNEKHPGLIDGVGMQGHYNLNTNPANVELSIQKFTSLGVEVSITELDVTAGSDGRLSDDDTTRQALVYARLFSIFQKHKGSIGRVTIWGLDDGSSWRADRNPVLFDRSFKAKKAFSAAAHPAEFIAGNPVVETVAKHGAAAYGTPLIDGAIDEIWNKAAALPVNQYLLAWQGATATAKALWDESNLYILMQVSDSALDKTSVNAYEQDSIEVFIDENNGKTSFFEGEGNDGQYRVNFANDQSFNPASIGTGVESAAVVSGTSYTVELKIPFKSITPSSGVEIGFDAQVNDASAGSRQSVAMWNDRSGNSFQDTSGYGVLRLER